jgi:hypothetical protein
MNMSGREDGHLVYKDAIFLSPHKLIGGPGTPGVLVAKRALLTEPCARRPRRRHRGLRQPPRAPLHRRPEHREEGGTPAIIESIRAGLVFQLKEAVGAERSAARGVVHPPRHRGLGLRTPTSASWATPRRGGSRSCRSWCATRSATCTTTSSWRCSTTCSGCRRGAAAPARGLTGTACWASTSTPRASSSARSCKGCEGIKPGWVRVNFNYFISEECFQFILQAVHFVAETAGSCCRTIASSPKTGQWRHREGRPNPAMSLHDLSYRGGKLQYRSRHATEPEWVLEDYLRQARRIVDEAGASSPAAPPAARWSRSAPSSP